MKKVCFLILITVLLCSCSGKVQQEVVYEVPDFPMEMSRQEVLDKIAEKGDFPNKASDKAQNERLIRVENFPLYSVTAKSVQFQFASTNRLMSIGAFFDKKDNNALRVHLTKLYGEPVESYRQSNLYHFMSGSMRAELFHQEEVAVGEGAKGRHTVWHSDKPLSQAWSKEEIEKFEADFKRLIEKGGKKSLHEEDWPSWYDESFFNEK